MVLATGKLIEALCALAEPVLGELGYELVDAEIAATPQGQAVRFYIDAPTGITLDDCTRVSRELDPLLDAADLISGNYHLEVSSPGVDRRLRKERDFARFAGEPVMVKTYGPVGDRKVFHGTLLGVEDARVRVRLEDQTERDIPLDQVARANLKRG